MATITEKTAKVLNELLAICDDSAKGFAKAAEDADATPLKRIFAEYAAQRAAYAAEMKRQITSLGETADDSGHAVAAFHRGWMTIKEAVGNKDKAIIDECEAGEDRAVKAYRDALEQDLPPSALHAVRSQLAGVLEAHNQVRSLKHSTN
jgi:uncharacterized protein (TIGR02284 family)